ncbi:MAG TPA: MarR family transcriptional regulator [Candidatus Polarisedimenticolia bacterium]|jgi:DNA-binding MarR family transcriptional regulator|nr:MarR family transcriptional regulator [Candidatus Polarisedimenticolia bacterium]
MPTAPASLARDPALDRDTRDLYAALTDLVRLYQFRDRNVICCHDVSVTQCYALQTLTRGGSMTLGALARDLLLDKSTASRVIETLERKGYVRRSSHPQDARAILIDLTAKGRVLHDRIERELLAEERGVIANLEPEVRRAAIGVVRDLARVAAARIGRNASCCAPDGE